MNIGKMDDRTAEDIAFSQADLNFLDSCGAKQQSISLSMGDRQQRDRSNRESEDLHATRQMIATLSKLNLGTTRTAHPHELRSARPEHAKTHPRSSLVQASLGVRKQYNSDLEPKPAKQGPTMGNRAKYTMQYEPSCKAVGSKEYRDVDIDKGIETNEGEEKGPALSVDAVKQWQSFSNKEGRGEHKTGGNHSFWSQVPQGPRSSQARRATNSQRYISPSPMRCSSDKVLSEYDRNTRATLAALANEDAPLVLRPGELARGGAHFYKTSKALELARQERESGYKKDKS